MTYSFRTINPSEHDWHLIESCYDSTVFKTKKWYDFLNTERCIPIIVEIRKDNYIIGFFLGEIVRRIIKIVGSPIKGFGTAHQGLSMLSVTSPSERLNIYQELSRWVFKERIAKLIEIEDFQLSMDDLKGTGLYYEGHDISYIDLSQNEEVLYHNLSQKSCRTKINKAIRAGVTIQESRRSIQEFLDIHYTQHSEVMKRHGLKEWESYENLKNLIETNYPENIILLEALSPEGECIASGIYPVGGRSSCSFSSASFKSGLFYSPNELLRWEAIKLCKRRGATIFNNSGTSDFKLKFGAIREYKPIVLLPKYRIILSGRFLLRFIYKKTYTSFQSLWYFIKKKGVR